MTASMPHPWHLGDNRTMDQLNELGFYVLAGNAAVTGRAHPTRSRPVKHSASAPPTFISERFNIKEAFTLSGAVGAVSSTLGIATAATNHNTRHPMVTAAHATTMHRLTGGRFTLGLGRGIAPLFDAYGIPRITTAQIEDFVGLMRRLWHGEVVFGHDGPAGKFPVLHIDASFDEDIPLGFVAFGPNSRSRSAGRCFDAVVLHTFFTDETVERCVATVRGAAEAAGRDPASVRIWSVFTPRSATPPPRTVAPQEDGRTPRHLSPGLRRSAGGDQRLGPRGAGALSSRRGRRDVSGRARHQGRYRRTRARRQHCCPTNGSSPRRPATPLIARRASCASSISA